MPFSFFFWYGRPDDVVRPFSIKCTRHFNFFISLHQMTARIIKKSSRTKLDSIVSAFYALNRKTYRNYNETNKHVLGLIIMKEERECEKVHQTVFISHRSRSWSLTTIQCSIRFSTDTE